MQGVFGGLPGNGIFLNQIFCQLHSMYTFGLMRLLYNAIDNPSHS